MRPLNKKETAFQPGPGTAGVRGNDAAVVARANSAKTTPAWSGGPGVAKSFSLSEDAALERAAGVLECLKDSNVGAGRRLLGGRVEAKPIDRGRLLRGYYTVLDRGRQLLARRPDAQPEVMRFLDGISMPDYGRPALLEAIGLSAIDPEPAAELGSQPIGLGAAAMNGVLSQYVAGVSLAFSDDAVTEIFGTHIWPSDLSELMSHHNLRQGDVFLEQLRIYARGRERDLPDLRVSNIEPIVAAIPRSALGMRVLGRLLAAFEIEPASISIDGVPFPGYRPAPDQRALRSSTGPSHEACTYNGAVQSWRNARQRHELESTLIDDETIKLIWNDAAQNHELEHFFEAPFDAEFVHGSLHLAARTREVGISTALSQTNIRQAIDAMPDDQPSVDALHRAASAFRWDTRRVYFKGRRLCDRPGPPGLRQVGLGIGPPLGKDVPLTASLAALQPNGNAADLAMSDQSLQDFLRNAGPNLPGLIAPRAYFTREQALALLRLLDRALEIHAEDSLSFDLVQPIRQQLPNILTPAVTGDRECMDLLASVMERAGIGPDLVFGHKALLKHPPFAAALERRAQLNLLDRAPLAPRTRLSFDESRVPHDQPLGDLFFDQGQRDQMWRTNDRRYLQMRDDCIQAHGQADMGMWLAVWGWEAFTFFARGSEIPRNGHHPFRAAGWGYLSSGVEERFLNAQSIPSILRLARTLEFPYERIQYKTQDGTPRWLLDHPDVPGRAELEETRLRAHDFVRKSVDSLCRSDSDESERGRVLAKLVSGDDPPAEIEDVLRALVEARGKDALIPAEVGQDAFDAWQHIGAIAIVASIASKLSIDAITDLLVSKGYDRASAREWAELGSKLSQLRGDDFAKATADLSGSPPSFSSLGARLYLACLDGALPADPGAAEAAASSDPAAFARILLERSLREEEPARQVEILGEIERAVSKRTLDAQSVRAAVSSLGAIDLDAEWPLSRALLDPLDAALDGQDDATIDEAFDRLALFAGAGVAVQRVLSGQYQRDLERVVPLGEVDSGREAVDYAIRRVRELAGEKTSPAGDDLQREWQWVDASLRRALESGRELDEETLLGIAEAFHAQLLSQKTLETARDALPREKVEELAEKTRASDARAVLRDRKRPRRVARTQFESPNQQVGAAKVVRGPSAPKKEPIDEY
jgi:hypothetical protein